MHIERHQLCETLPGNYGGETLRQYCGLSRQRRRGKLHFKDAGVSSQDLYRAINAHVNLKKKGTKNV